MAINGEEAEAKAQLRGGRAVGAGGRCGGGGRGGGRGRGRASYLERQNERSSST